MKPVYTQEMKDKGKLPQEGMEFIINYQELLSRYNDMDGLVATVISVSECGIITFNTIAGLGALRLPPSNCKVIITTIDLEDGAVYQFDYNTEINLVGRYVDGESGGGRFMIDKLYFPHDLATNIIKLVPEGKS